MLNGESIEAISPASLRLEEDVLNEERPVEGARMDTNHCGDLLRRPRVFVERKPIVSSRGLTEENSQHSGNSKRSEAGHGAVEASRDPEPSQSEAWQDYVEVAASSNFRRLKREP